MSIKRKPRYVLVHAMWDRNLPTLSRARGSDTHAEDYLEVTSRSSTPSHTPHAVLLLLLVPATVTLIGYSVPPDLRELRITGSLRRAAGRVRR